MTCFILVRNIKKKFCSSTDLRITIESWMLKNAGTECSGKSKDVSLGIALQDRIETFKMSTNKRKHFTHSVLMYMYFLMFCRSCNPVRLLKVKRDVYDDIVCENEQLLCQTFIKSHQLNMLNRLTLKESSTDVMPV